MFKNLISGSALEFYFGPQTGVWGYFEALVAEREAPNRNLSHWEQLNEIQVKLCADQKSKILRIQNFSIWNFIGC